MKTEVPDGQTTEVPVVSESVVGSVKRVLFRPGWATVPAALFELLAAGLVVNHAASAPDMAAVVWASAFILALYFTWVFHHAGVLRRRHFQNFILFIKLVMGSLLVLVLWELGGPHPVWTGQAIGTTESSYALNMACVFVTLSILLLIVFRAFRVLVALVRTLRTRFG